MAQVWSPKCKGIFFFPFFVKKKEEKKKSVLREKTTQCITELSFFLVDISQTTLSAVVSVKVLRHEGTRALRADLSEPLHVTASVDLVVLQRSKLNLLVLMLDLLWLGVGLLLSLLTTTSQTEDQVQGALLLDVVVGKSSSVLELLSGKDKTLLVRWDALLVLDLSLDILDGVGALDLKSDGLTRKGLDENLHGSFL